MANLTRAAEELQKFARSLKNVLELCESFEQAGSMENYVKEIEAQQHHAAANLAKINQDINEADALLTLTRNQITNAKVMAEKEIANAKKEAESIIADAKKEAESVVSAAKVTKLAVQVEIENLNREVAALHESLVIGGDELASIKAQKQAVLDQLKQIVGEK